MVCKSVDGVQSLFAGAADVATNRMLHWAVADSLYFISPATSVWFRRSAVWGEGITALLLWRVAAAVACCCCGVLPPLWRVAAAVECCCGVLLPL